MKLKSVFHMFMLIALFTFLSTAMAQEKKRPIPNIQLMRKQPLNVGMPHRIKLKY